MDFYEISVVCGSYSSYDSTRVEKGKHPRAFLDDFKDFYLSEVPNGKITLRRNGIRIYFEGYPKGDWIVFMNYADGVTVSFLAEGEAWEYDQCLYDDRMATANLIATTLETRFKDMSNVQLSVYGTHYPINQENSISHGIYRGLLLGNAFRNTVTLQGSYLSVQSSAATLEEAIVACYDRIENYNFAFVWVYVGGERIRSARCGPNCLSDIQTMIYNENERNRG